MIGYSMNLLILPIHIMNKTFSEIGSNVNTTIQNDIYTYKLIEEPPDKLAIDQSKKF